MMLPKMNFRASDFRHTVAKIREDPYSKDCISIKWA